MTGGSTHRTSLVCDWLFALSLSLWSALSTLIIMYHSLLLLLLTPTPLAFHSLSFFLSHSQSAPFAPLISSIRSVHYVHSTCGAHFISLHLGEREWPPLPLVSDEYMSKAYMHTHTHTSWLLSALSGGSVHSFNLSLSPFCKLIWKTFYDRTLFCGKNVCIYTQKSGMMLLLMFHQLSWATEEGFYIPLCFTAPLANCVLCNIYHNVLDSKVLRHFNYEGS